MMKKLVMMTAVARKATMAVLLLMMLTSVNAWALYDCPHTSLTHHPAVAATCTTAGNTEYWSCNHSECPLKYFSSSNASGSTAIAENSWIIPASHTLTAHPAVAATCTTAGNSAYWECTACGKYFSDENGENEIDEDSWIIAATGHDMTAHAEVTATCTTAGNSAYWSCSRCGKYFSDANGENEIEENSWVIAASGHNVEDGECSRCHRVTTPYIDADGTAKNELAMPLNGTETTLDAGWYVVNSDITYTSGITLNGDVTIILADGYTMTVGNTMHYTSGINEKVGIYLAGNLNIYGQGGGTGKLNVNAEDNIYGIYATAGDGNGKITINGGIVEASGESIGITGTEVTINGGTVKASGSDGISAKDININGGHLEATGSSRGIIALINIIISGGQIEAVGGSNDAGIHATNGDITLGWKNSTDYINASSYYVKNSNAVKTANGQRFVAYTPTGTPGTEGFNPSATGTTASAIVSGSSNDSNPTFTLAAIAGKTLKPLDGNFVSINSGDFAFNESANTTTSPFTITTGEGENATTTHYYIYKKDDTATLSYTGSGIVQVTGATLGAVENQPTQRTFTMAAADVVLTATAVTDLTATSVAYNGSARTPVIKQGDDVFAAANYTIAYKVGDDDVTAADVKDAKTYTCTLTGLGQYVGTAGGIDFTINPKALTVTANNHTISYGEEAENGGVTYDGFIESENQNTVGIFTTALSYTYKTAADGTGEDYTTSSPVGTYYIIPGGLTAANYDITFAAGTLRVVHSATLFAANSTNLWATFCDTYERTVPEGCTAYELQSVDNGVVTVRPLMDGEAVATTIPAYTPVLIKRESGGQSQDIKPRYYADGIEPATGYNAETGLVSASATNWNFYGNAGTTGAAITGVINTGEQTAYALYNDQLIRIEGDPGIQPHRCVLNVAGGTTAPVLTINPDITDITEVREVKGVREVKDNSWYTLDGRKLEKQPIKKGIYINGGRKVVIK